MSEIVERAAQAAYAKWRERIGSLASFPLWDQATPSTREFWIASQRTAIAALREPTEKMIDAAGAEYDYDDFPIGSKQVWQEMIDAALAKD